MRDSATRPRKLAVMFFNEIDINLKFDSVASTFRLQMYFDPNNEEHAELATVSHIHECSLYYVHDRPGKFVNDKGKFVTTNDELIITGFMLSQRFHSSEKPGFMEIGGYSKPGMLGDCDIPTAAYPLESNGLSFRQIVKKILPYFSNPKKGGFNFFIKSSRADSVFVKEGEAASGLGDLNDLLGEINDDADGDLGKSTAPESKNVLSYLSELANQKGLILSHDVMGNFIVNAPYLGNDYLFEIGTKNGIKYREADCNYNGQGLHSQVEAVRQPDKNGGNMAYAIEYNPLVPIVFRPKVIEVTSGDDNTIRKAALNEVQTELKSIPLVITLDSPVANGRFIMPNHTIKVLERKCYLYKATKWFIEEVNYVKNSKEETCTITCVLPGVYGGKIVNPFIDPHHNIPRI